MTRPSSLTLAVITLAAGALVGASDRSAPREAGVEASLQLAPYRDSIPGTLVTFDMVPVPGGTVELATAEGGRATEVEAFWIGRTEVTWDEYDVFALRLDVPGGRGEGDATARPSRPYGAPDRGFGHAGYPAMSITRHAAEAYCAWLSAKTGRRYRLPTDAEWSRAVELGFSRSDGFDRDRLEPVAWFRANAGGSTHPVASKAPDALGLSDMLGNVAEWVVLADASAAVRGGSYRDPADAVRPDARARQTDSWNESDPQIPKSRWWLSDAPFVGFRIVRSP